MQKQQYLGFDEVGIAINQVHMNVKLNPNYQSANNWISIDLQRE